MSSIAHAEAGRVDAIRGELAKLPAFIRRDFFTLLSYRMGFVSDWVGLAFQVVFLYFVGKLVDTSQLPTFGGRSVTYLEFAAVGIALGVFVQIGLARVSTAIRTEQVIGTLEALLVTPTATATIQFGSAMFDVVYIPIRTAVFLGAVAGIFGLDFSGDGILPAAIVLLVFAPVMWGLGLISAAAVLTFRRGEGFIGIGASLLALSSGAYFPLSLLPGWVATVAELNPLAVALKAMRDAVLGGEGWTVVPHAVAVLAPSGVIALVLGSLAFRFALARERRLGTLGLY